MDVFDLQQDIKQIASEFNLGCHISDCTPIMDFETSTKICIELWSWKNYTRLNTYKKEIAYSQWTKYQFDIDLYQKMIDEVRYGARLLAKESRKISNSFNGKEDEFMDYLLAINDKQLGICLRMLYADGLECQVKTVLNSKNKIEFHVKLDVNQNTFQSLKDRYKILIS